MRNFETGATRNTDTNKNDYEGFLSPFVLEEFGNYMTIHRVRADGNIRASDNWQKGIPVDVYMKSLWRHFLDLWKLHRGGVVISSEDGHRVTMEEACCAVMFNIMGILHETLTKDKTKDKIAA